MANPAPALLSRPEQQAKGQFQPGVSGNPLGRLPLPQCLTPRIRALLDGATPPNADSVARALLDKCQEGDVPAIKEVWDRVEGRVPNPIQITSTSVNLEIAAQYSDLAGNLRLGIAAGVFGQLVELDAPEPSTDVPEETPDST